MKKIAVLVTVLMLFSLVFTACSKAPAGEETTAEETTLAPVNGEAETENQEAMASAANTEAETENQEAMASAANTEASTENNEESIFYVG